MWTTANRRRHDRTGLRCPSDPTDAEWALAGPLIGPAKHGGRQRSVDERGVLNAIFYVLATGGRWRAPPEDFPPRSTAHGYLQLWAWDGGTLTRLHHALYVEARERAGRGASPSAAILDSQSVKGAEKGGAARRSDGLRRGQEGRGQEAPPSWSTRSACC